MTEPLDWEDWRNKPVITRHVRFTGFGEGGNGFSILAWLDERGTEAVGRDGNIYLQADDRDEALAEPGCWLVIGTRNEVYPVRPDVHGDKYERTAASA